MGRSAQVSEAAQTMGGKSASISKQASSSAKNLKLAFFDGKVAAATITEQRSPYRPTASIQQSLYGQEILIRALDIAGSVTILFLAMLPMLVVALLVRIFSSGTILYRQKRVGKDGKIFILYKFRTMVNNAEEHTGPVWAAEDDPRVTPIGRILRKTRLDELPQLFNVLWGDMSLVGPRPERPHFVKQHRALQGIRLAVKPGLTGLAQIRNSYDLRPEHKTKYDYLYIRKRSVLLNLYILLQTVPVIFSKKGW
jgi:lipopolysaccharide/colanic/teichoic acid biosynthesis glycosyltransferase